MISQFESEKRNLESSLLFMQQEHSKTLKALHEEISRLQKRCSELTFQLTMVGIDDAEYDKEDYEKKMAELMALLKATETKHEDLEKELVKKDETIKELKSQLRRNERKYLEELKSKTSQVLALKVELDTKSVTIANLTSDIHRLKVLRISNENPPHPTTPPSRGKSSRRQTSRRPSAATTDIESRPITAKSSMQAPDADLFLARTSPKELAAEVNMKPTPPVLPPISGEVKTFNRRQQLLRRRLDIKAQPEYTSLAVDQLASSSNTYIHEPNTTK